jgi:dynein heavy chain
MVKMSL